MSSSTIILPIHTGAVGVHMAKGQRVAQFATLLSGWVFSSSCESNPPNH
eukprot:COSAG06_NODE_66436_length_254_cov_0.787097_1_plen_48_part_01